MNVREYKEADVPAMARIWNEVVEQGMAFPQESPMTNEEASCFFAQQTHCGVAEMEGKVVGMYILHPNNIGRCGHIGNASYAVAASCRGQGVGEQLVRDCIEKARETFRLIQFNAVVEGNIPARHLYEKLGFQPLGTIPEGFRLPDGSYANICLYYLSL